MKEVLYEVDQIRQLESWVFSEQYDTEYGLMIKAGSAAFELMTERWPEMKTLLVLCGKGNNSGDGFVLARLAQEAGLLVTVIAMAAVTEYEGPALKAAQACVSSSIDIRQYSGILDIKADLIVDALLGIGLRGVLSQDYQAIIRQANTLQSPILSLDVPSGLEANTGAVMSEAIKAEVTITFLGKKRGLFTGRAAEYCGEVVCHSLQLSDQFFSRLTASAEIATWNQVRGQLPRRKRDAHKGCFGHVLVIGGDYGFSGAVRMAAEAALRVGSGLVSVATRKEHLAVVSGTRPEIMCHPVGTEEDLYPLLEKISVVLIGPGLGTKKWAKMLLDAVLSYDCEKVLDADALNLLSEKQAHSNQWVLTPHPGEASRLLKTTTHWVQQDRFKAIASLQDRYRGIIVLKGAGTLIRDEGGGVKVCPQGNPGMASGGMGDVLSGVIAGFIAQGLSLSFSATLAVSLHAAAGDCAAAELGERGLLASDLLSYLPRLLNSKVESSQ